MTASSRMVRVMADLASLVLKVDSRDINRAKTALDSLGTTAAKTERANDGMARSARGAGLAFGGLASFITTASAAAGAAKFVQIADQMTNLESRIRLTMKATESYTDIQSKLSDIARNSVTSLQDVGTLYARIAPSIERLGGTQRESLAITSALTNALRINGATTAEASSAVIQFSQAMQSGVLRGEEFNALNENAGPLLDALAQQLGKTRGELRQMAFDGLLTSDVVANNILPAVAGLEARAASMGVTSSAAFQDLRDAVSVAIGEIDKASGATAALSGVVSGATKEVTDLIAAMRTGELSATQQDMVGIAGAVGGATVAVGGLAVAIGTITAAQWLFNAAVRANPLIMGLSVVTAGIAAAYGYAKAQDAAKSSQDKLNDALKQKADIDARLASSSPSVVDAARRVSASTNARVAELQKIVAAEKNVAELKIINESAAELAADQSRKGQTKSAAGYVKLSGAAKAAADVVKKASNDKAKAAEDAAKRIRDAQAATQSALDDQYLQQNLGMSSASLSLLNDPNATPDQINQNNALEAQAIAADKAKVAIEGAQAAFDSYMSASFGSDLASGFDQASAALGRFVQGIETLGAIEAGNAAARKGAEAEYLAGKIDQETLTKKLAKLESKNASDQIGAFADITGAAKGMFKEQSAGAKALGKIEQTLRVAQLAHSAWEKKDEAVKLAVKLKGYAIDLGTFIASVPLKIAGFLGIGGAAGAAATAAAAIQPGPAAFVGFAAMAALIASIGLGGRGGGGGATAFNPQISTAGGTGSVLGDPQAQSETLKKSIDKLGDIASIELRFTSQTLNVLRQIEENTGGFDTSLAKLNVAIGAQVRNIGIPSGFTAADVSSAPEKFSKQFFAALVGEKNNFSNTQGAAVGNLFTSQVVLPTIAGFKELAALVGASANQIDAALSGTVIGGGRFGGEDAGRNLNQLSAEDRANLIAATASTLLDQLFGTLVGVAPSLSYFKDFQRAGEGIGETLIRVKSSIELADNMLGRLGVTALDVSVITRKQGDLTTEIIRESVLLQDATKNIIGGFAEIVGSFDGTGEEITDLVLQLREMQDAIRATGKAGEYLTTFMIAGAGGADRLSDGLSAFFDFLSPAEQAAELTRRISNEFTRIGQIVPQSVQGFRELIAGIDISTESGQKLYGQVIALAPAFSDLQDALASVGDEAQDAKDAITKAFKDLSDAIKTAESDLQAAFNRESTALKELIRNHDDAAKRLREFSRTLVGALDTPEQSLTRLRAEFDAIARAARLGDSGAVARLPEVGGALKDAVIANAATAQDAAREIARIRAESDAAATVQERQKTIAEQQLDALTLSVDSLIQVGDNILTVRDAVDNLKALQTFENKAIADATAAGFGALFQQNGQTLSAIEKGTQASASINASIQGLLDITARQEAARIASEQAQQAAIEQAKRDAAERTRLETVAKLNADLGASVATVGQTKATIDDALTRIKTLGGDRIANAVSNSAANASFARGALGESLSDAAFLDVTGGKNQASRESAANAAANAAFYGNLSTLDVVRGGLNEQLVSAYSRSDALRQQIISLGGIPAFATGGMHSGGLRLVGENGPELEYTGPSRIFNAGQTSNMLDNSDQIAEMRLLRDEMKSYLWSISKSTLRTADRLDRWDDGDRMNVRIDNEADDPALVRTVA